MIKPMSDEEFDAIDYRIDEPIILMGVSEERAGEILRGVQPIIGQLVQDRRRLFDEVRRLRAWKHEAELRQKAEQDSAIKQYAEFFMTGRQT